MDANTSTYRLMYDGNMLVSDDAHQNIDPWEEHDPIYYKDSIGFEITPTNKLAPDKPTLTISIPCQTLGIDVPNETESCAEADFCLRAFKKYIDELNANLYNRSRPDNENGKYYLCAPGGEVLKRNTAYFAIRRQKDYINGSGIMVYLLNDGISRPPVMSLCIRMQVQLPQKKLRKAMQMLCKDLPGAVESFVRDFDLKGLKEVRTLAQKQCYIRRWLKMSDYCAFVANGSILPREKGSDLPMRGAVPFKSPPADEIEICGVMGMGIKKGVTVITGGGYSGKSTLLDAVSAGIYDHVLGDGRELCITDESAVTISAEDGRSVKHVNISPFIKWLPERDASDFSTDHASGSTSQAANIMEALECGASLLLIDEDRSATNFMIRDKMMKALIEKEPITPFTDRVNELYTKHGVSTILVIGGSGEYLSVADKIYMMEDYLIHDVTDKAKKVCESYGAAAAPAFSTDWTQGRILYSECFTSYPLGRGSERLEVSDMGFIIIGDECIDVRGLCDVISSRQLDTLGFMLRYLEVTNNEQRIDIQKRIDDLYAQINEEGMDFLYSDSFTSCKRFLDLPRRHELMALINRMKKINIVNIAKENNAQ